MYCAAVRSCEKATQQLVAAVGLEPVKFIENIDVRLCDYGFSRYSWILPRSGFVKLDYFCEVIFRDLPRYSIWNIYGK